MEHPVTIRIPLAWGEQDGFGHLNNVVYFRYFENVRMYYLEKIGVLRSHKEDGIGVILASTKCDFLRPVQWPNDLLVSTGCSTIGRTSFTMTYSIADQEGKTIATGSSVQVMFDYAEQHKVQVPDRIRMAIRSIQPNLPDHEN